MLVLSHEVSKKDYDSAHSRLTKRAIAYSSLSQAESVCNQVFRLEKRGHRDSLIVSVQGRTRNERRPAVLNYVHGVSHQLKKVGEKHDAPAVFTAPLKLAGMCRQKQKAVHPRQHVRSDRRASSSVVSKVSQVRGHWIEVVVTSAEWEHASRKG